MINLSHPNKPRTTAAPACRRGRVVQAYLKNAPFFMSLIRSIEARLFQKYDKYIRHPILDFGCGDGFFAETVFEERIDIGLDLKTNPRIQEAKKRTIYKKILLYDGATIPLPDNTVQTIVSNCVFEHIPHIENSLSELYRILKPGGFLITSVMTSQWSKNMLGTRLFGKSYADWMNKKQEHHSLLSMKQWDTCFKKNKFTIIKKIGYLDTKQSQYLDLFHYVSIPSLLSYMLFKKWVIIPKLFDIVPFHTYIMDRMQETEDTRFSAFFYILKKPYNK